MLLSVTLTGIMLLLVLVLVIGLPSIWLTLELLLQVAIYIRVVGLVIVVGSWLLISLLLVYLTHIYFYQYSSLLNNNLKILRTNKDV